MSNAAENLKMLFAKMDDFVSTKTVVGEPVTMGDVTLIPLIDVSFGMATGVTASKEDESPKKGKDGGAGGIGAKMTPSAVIVINNGTVHLVNVKGDESLTSKLVDMVPGLLAKVSAMFGKKDGDDDGEDFACDLPDVE